MIEARKSVPGELFAASMRFMNSRMSNINAENHRQSNASGSAPSL